MDGGELLRYLEGLPGGAFAVSMDQTIVMWNDGASEMLGHETGWGLGRKCYEVMPVGEEVGLTPRCRGGCALLRYARAGVVPSALEMGMRSGDGVWKRVRVRPVVIGGEGAGVLLVYLLDALEGEGTGEEGVGTMLSGLELDVLGLVGRGWKVENIGIELGIPQKEVVSCRLSVRWKLGLRSRVDVVLAAVRLGQMEPGDFDVEARFGYEGDGRDG